MSYSPYFRVVLLVFTFFTLKNAPVFAASMNGVGAGIVLQSAHPSQEVQQVYYRDEYDPRHHYRYRRPHGPPPGYMYRRPHGPPPGYMYRRPHGPPPGYMYRRPIMEEQVHCRTRPRYERDRYGRVVKRWVRVCRSY